MSVSGLNVRPPKPNILLRLWRRMKRSWERFSDQGWVVTIVTSPLSDQRFMRVWYHTTTVRAIRRNNLPTTETFRQTFPCTVPPKNTLEIPNHHQFDIVWALANKYLYRSDLIYGVNKLNVRCWNFFFKKKKKKFLSLISLCGYVMPPLAPAVDLRSKSRVRYSKQRSKSWGIDKEDAKAYNSAFRASR